jgi:hypothetical protein
LTSGEETDTEAMIFNDSCPGAWKETDMSNMEKFILPGGGPSNGSVPMAADQEFPHRPNLFSAAGRFFL